MENIKNIVDDNLKWIKNQLDSTGAKGFVVGISGGKDSAVVAGLLCKAVGNDKVFGVLMPNGEQSDIKDSVEVCEKLNIKYKTVNIKKAYDGLVSELGETSNRETLINIMPRLRMTTLYATAQEMGFLVCGTGNKSETYIGYFTKWGDGGCDINPIGDFTTDEVVAIGEYLNVPSCAIHKPPSDGISGISDEEKIGFKYEDLNNYLKTGLCEDHSVKDKITKRHNANLHKLKPIPVFKKN